MRRKLLFLMPLMATLLISCTQNHNENKSESKSEESVEPSEPSEPSSPDRLEAPVLTLNSDKTGLTWNAIDGAISYELKVNDGEPHIAVSYQFSSVAGNYSVSVRAVASNSANNSEFSAPFTYVTKITELEDLDLVNGEVKAVGLVGNGLLYQFNDGEWVEVNGNSFAVNESGVYSVTPNKGFNEESNTFYVDSEITKSIFASKVGNQEYVIDDGDGKTSKLQVEWDVKKYSNDWVASSATLASSDESVDVTLSNCIRFDYWDNTTAFKYSKAIDVDASYDTLSFYLRTNGISQVTFRLSIENTAAFGDFDFTGVYFDYKFTEHEARWMKHNLSFNDNNWTVNYNGQSKTTDEIVQFLTGAGLKVSSFTSLIPLFDTFSIIFRGDTPNGANAKSYIDEIQLINTNAESSHEEVKENVRVRSEYAFRSENVHGRINIVSRKNITMDLFKGSEHSVLNLGLELDETRITLTSLEEGKDFVLHLVSEDNGKSFNFENATGSLASDLNGVKLSVMKMIDDFSEYDETGVGYNAFNDDPDLLSGLRGSYYSDRYTGKTSDSSVIGGKNWTIIDDEDYLYLNKEAGVGDDQSGQFKVASNSYSGNIRFMQMALANQEIGISNKGATAIGSFNKFSFMAKGSVDRDVQIKFRVYYRDNVGPTTQELDHTACSAITIPQNSSWTEYTINLDNTKTYYGFSMYTLKGGNVDTSLLIDNICMYDDELVSPFAF